MWIHGCFSKIYNETVRGDMGLDALQSCTDRTIIEMVVKASYTT